MKTLQWAITLIFIHLLYSEVSFGRMIVVSPEGSDHNTAATLQAPLASLTLATSLARAGDTVVLVGGVYNIDKQQIVRCVGTAQHPVVIMPLSPDSVIFDAQGLPVADNKGTHFTSRTMHEEGAILIMDAKHVVLRGITVRHSHMGGVNIRSSKNILIEGVSTLQTLSSGIGAWFSDSIEVRNCLVIEANSPLMDESGRGRKGGHEAISFGSTFHFAIHHNELRNFGKEGIDVKQACRHGKVFSNHVHHGDRQGIYVDGYPFYHHMEHLYTTENDSLYDIDIFDNHVHDCGMGIIVSAEGGTPVSDVIIRNNLIYNCKNSGLHVASYFGKNGPRNNIQILNNTVAFCGLGQEFWWSSGGIFIETWNIRDVVVRNNICYRNGVFQLAFTGQDTAQLAIRADHNLIFGDQKSVPVEEIIRLDTIHNRRKVENARKDPTKKMDYHGIVALGEKAVLIADPLFSDPQGGDFALLAGSPALTAGSDAAGHSTRLGSDLIVP